MNTESIGKQFARMGARFRLVHQEAARWSRNSDYALDIRSDRHGQVFELRMPEAVEASHDVAVLNVQPQDRHLVLLVKNSQRKDRFLCGHDEREWFVAAVPEAVTTVTQAKESLKPKAIRHAEVRWGLRASERARRHNAASIRQGEWFFLPRPGMTVASAFVRCDEPIRRGGGKPHLVAQLYRTGGEVVHVCTRYPNGLAESQYQKLLASRPKAKSWGWTMMRRNPGVYARGTVRHPDHATITLPYWHQVLMNTETESPTMAKVAFLD
ncbi:MAG: hypothetical protein ACAH88_02320 [Roseimicrobium sp.]